MTLDTVIFFIVGLTTNLLMYILHIRQFDKMFPANVIKTSIPVLKWFNGLSNHLTAQIFALVDGACLGMLIIVPLYCFNII